MVSDFDLRLRQVVANRFIPKLAEHGQRLQSDGTDTYTYDNNGNQITKTSGFAYTWDYENRLTGITGPGLTASYSYDYLGRRISKTLNSVTTTYLYDGQNLIREVSASTADYVFGPGIDEPLAMSRSSAIYYYTADGLGSINVLNDSAGTAQDKYVLDAWGVTKSSTTPIANTFTYTARETAEAGLMYYRARYYNPTNGRFIREDPKRLHAGRNFYAYVQNHSVKFIDPLGLIEVTPDVQGCCRDRIRTIQDAANTACKNKDKGECTQVLNRYNRKKCFDEKCNSQLVIHCGGVSVYNFCAESNKPSEGQVTFYSKVFSPFPRTVGCTNLQGTIAHEIGHLCGIGSDTDNYANYIEARNIGYACDDDPSTIVDW